MTDAPVRTEPAVPAPWIRLYRLAFGLLIVIALVEDFRHTTQSAGNFFSFFTVQSNIFGVVILLLGATTLIPPSQRWDYTRGAAMVFMLLTGVVYNLLLRSLGSDTAPWINNTLHVVAPIVLVVDFFIDPLRYHLRYVRALWWTAFPLGYAAYSLLRGPLVDWYPYGFLNPTTDGGWTKVAMYVVAIAVGFLAVSWVVVRFSNWRLARSTG